MPVIVALAAGLLFGLGLTVSGMINPAKVLAFLDIAGDWDPSLAFVMIGAVTVAAIGFRLGAARSQPVCAEAFSPPVKRDIDVRLASGAVMFAVGWGLIGFCPGPALASLGFLYPSALIFIGAMLVGMLAFQAMNRPAPGIRPSVATGGR